MHSGDRTDLLRKISRIAQKIRSATDSPALLAELEDVAKEYAAKEEMPQRKLPSPEPRVEQGGVNRMEPESTPTVTRKKKTSE
jgi:hypothetical protein